MKNIFIKHKQQYYFSESEKEKENSILIWKGIVGFFGCLCFFYSIRQCNLFVIIGLDFILKLYTVIGLIFTILLYKIDKAYEKNDYSFIEIYFQKFFTYGSIFLAIFIFTNEHLSTSKEYEITALILEKKEGLNRSGSANEITVKIGESKTVINVAQYSFEKIKKSNYAKIKLKNGYWNKLLILDTKLVE
jgi:hypothetical protein